jgi:methionyl aminopeptidase
MLKRCISGNGIRLKSLSDIKRINEASFIINGIFDNLASIELAGMSTWELDSIIDYGIVKCRARPAFKTVRGYSFASCISLNDEVTHGIPSKRRKIKSGDIVKIDIGVALAGYFADSCRTYPIGDISENAKNLIKITKECLDIGISQIELGKRLGDIGWAIENHAGLYKCNIVRKYAGHGIGFALHEEPIVPHYGKIGSGPIIEEGLVIALEPIVNEGCSEVKIHKNGWTAGTADGKLSAQFESTIAATANGPLVLGLD